MIPSKSLGHDEEVYRQSSGQVRFGQPWRRRWWCSEQVAAANAPPPTSVDAPPTRRDIYLHRKQRGVNLGSWFSLEGWLTPSLFQKAKEPKGSEFDVVAGMDPDEAKAMLETHWDNFINDGDLQWMVDHGINTVRIPVGYFHFLAGHPNEQVRALLKDTDFEKYAPIYQGAYARIQRAIESAASRNVGVLVDLHGAPGGQGADGHCGVSSGKAAMWNSRSDQQKTIEILKVMAAEYSRFENVVGLELINEPKNSGKLQGFYDEAVSQIRSVSPEAAALPLYIGDAWDTNHYTGYVGQRASANNFIVADHHLYRCFDGSDHAIRCEDHARKLHPGTSPVPTNTDGCGETANWLASMSQKCGGSLIIGEWSAALNPSSLHHLGDENGQRPAKAEYAHNEWKSFDKFCAGYFSGRSKRRVRPIADGASIRRWRPVCCRSISIRIVDDVRECKSWRLRGTERRMERFKAMQDTGISRKVGLTNTGGSQRDSIWLGTTRSRF